MSLPSEWIDRIFARLSLTYGHHFTGRWSGLDLDAVKADWGRELARYADRPKAIRYALENLPADNAPNALQFRALCAAMPNDTPIALPAPSPEGIKRIAEVMGSAPVGMASTAALIERHRAAVAAGTATAAQREWLRDVCRTQAAESSSPLDFAPVPRESLPPGMRA